MEKEETHMNKCGRCGAQARIVNECGCDKNNMPTKVNYAGACQGCDKPDSAVERWGGYCYTCATAKYSE